MSAPATTGRRAAGRPRPGSARLDAGSGSVWVLAVGALVMVVAWTVVTAVAAVAARHRAESAADLAALAAAGATQSQQDTCAAAHSIADANQASVTGCSSLPDGSVEVTVAVRPGAMVTRWVSGDAVAVARAGPAVSPAERQATVGDPR